MTLRIPRNQRKGYTLKEHFRFKKRRKHLTSIKNGYSDEEKGKNRCILGGIYHKLNLYNCINIFLIYFGQLRKITLLQNGK